MSRESVIKIWCHSIYIFNHDLQSNLIWPAIRLLMQPDVGGVFGAFFAYDRQGLVIGSRILTIGLMAVYVGPQHCAAALRSDGTIQCWKSSFSALCDIVEVQ